MFDLYKLITEVLKPYPLLFLLIGLALVREWRRPREGRRRPVSLSILFGLLTLGSLPAFSHLALGTLEWGYPPLRTIPPDATAIVVLGCGILPPDGVRLKTELPADAVARCMHALEVHRRAPRLPIILSGGKALSWQPGPTESETMRDFLRDAGVPPEVLRIEDRSRTTYENGLGVARLLKETGLRRVILVTDARQMRRALGVFRKLGIDAVPSACAHRATRFERSLLSVVPSPRAAADCEQVFHEWLGLLVYRVRGKL